MTALDESMVATSSASSIELAASGRDLVAAADAWRHQELAPIMARLATAQRAAVADVLELLVEAAGEDYPIAARRPVLLCGVPP